MQEKRRNDKQIKMRDPCESLIEFEVELLCFYFYVIYLVFYNKYVTTLHK